MSKEKSDLNIKIFALAIAIILWSYVMSEVNPERTVEYRNIEVAISNLSQLEEKGLVLMEPKELTVDVKVTGKKNDIIKFSPDFIDAEVDLSGYQEGEFKVPINIKLKEGFNLRIEDQEPRDVLFKIDKLISESREISIKTIGELEEGKIVDQVTSQTKTIEISGPRSWVEKVSQVIATVDITGKSESETISAPIKLLDREGEEVVGVKKDKNVIKVDLSIFKALEVPIELQTINSLPDNLQIIKTQIIPEKVKVKIDEESLSLSSIKTKPIDISGFTGEKEIEVQLEVPQGVELINPEEKIKIKFTIENLEKDKDDEKTRIEKTFEFGAEDLSVEKLKEDFKIDKIDLVSDMKLVIIGEKENLDKISKENIELVLNLEDLEEGRHTVKIQVKDLQGLEIKSYDPKEVEVYIVKK